MPEFLTESEEELRERLRRAYEKERGPGGEELFPDQDVPGTPAHNNRELFVRVLADLSRQVNRQVSNQSPRFASGPALDDWAEYFGVSRSEASRGRGEVLFTSRQTGAALEETFGSRALTAGTLLNRGTQAVARLEEDARVPLEGDSTRAQVSAARAGDVAPIREGTQLTPEGNLSGQIQGEVVSPIQGGSSRETDEQLRFRLSRALRSPSTVEGLEADLLGDEAVRNVELEENPYGPGTVEAQVSPAVAYPTESDRTRIRDLAAGPSRVYVVFPAYEGLALQVETEASGAKEAVSAYVGELQEGETLQMESLESEMTRLLGEPTQVIGAARGDVENGELVRLEKVGPARRLAPRGERGKFYCPPDRVEICLPQ
jgi:hypothetical protein